MGEISRGGPSRLFLKVGSGRDLPSRQIGINRGQSRLSPICLEISKSRVALPDPDPDLSKSQGGLPDLDFDRTQFWSGFYPPRDISPIVAIHCAMQPSPAPPPTNWSLYLSIFLASVLLAGYGEGNQPLPIFNGALVSFLASWRQPLGTN